MIRNNKSAMWRSALLLDSRASASNTVRRTLQHARDMHEPARTALAALVLVASVAGLRSPNYSLRETPPSSCGFAHYGSATGSEQHLVETHLSAGVADWNIVVPMPPTCAQAPVTGVHMRVCDNDEPPDVSLSDAQSARVHRTGALAGFATVNVTVYCILPPPSPPPPPPPPPPPSDLADSRTTYEIFSKELSSNEENSNEEILNESESMELTSAELITTTVKPTSSTTLAPEETTAKVELTSPTEVITPPPHKTVHPKQKTPQSLKVTIHISPTNQVSSKEDVSQSYNTELPSLSNKQKSNEVMSSQGPTLSSVPIIATPPRISEWPQQKRIKRPRDSSLPLGAPTPRAPRPPRRHPAAARPPHYMHAPHYVAAPPYNLSPPPYPVAPLYRPLSWLGPRLSYLQHHQPLLIFRHF